MPEEDSSTALNYCSSLVAERDGRSLEHCSISNSCNNQIARQIAAFQPDNDSAKSSCCAASHDVIGEQLVYLSTTALQHLEHLQHEQPDIANIQLTDCTYQKHGRSCRCLLRGRDYGRRCTSGSQGHLRSNAAIESQPHACQGHLVAQIFAHRVNSKGASLYLRRYYRR